MQQSNNRDTSRSTLASMQGEARDPMIESCEQRLALSGSLAGDVLLDLLDIQAQSLESESQPESSNPDAIENLIDQANQLRESHSLDGSGQTVAVIDSGIAWDHVALGEGFGPGYRVVGGWDFAENDANPYDDGPVGFHGSHVAGLLAGESNDFQGIAPGADLVGLRVFDDYGSSELEWIESALQWVHDNRDSFASPITTVNLSVGAALGESTFAEANAMLADELELLRNDDILVFAAAGNFFGTEQADGENQILFPASDPNVVAISSIDDSGSLSEFAQREQGILATQGEDVRSSVPDHVFGWDGKVDDFTALSGTSMATPQAAGASMLIRQAMIEQGLEPTAEDVLARLQESAHQQVDPITGESFSRIDLQKATDLPDDPITNETPVINKFNGDNDSDNAVLDLRDGIQLHVDGQTFPLQANQAGEPIVIDVGGGADSIQIIGSSAAERLFAYPTTQFSDSDVSVLSTNEFKIQLRGFENIVFDGGGGPDSATLFDSPADDMLTSETNKATLQGTGFQFDVINVDRVYVHGTSGGDDTAFLHDSPADETLSVRPQFTSLRSDNTFQMAYGFERVYAYAQNGGNDTATIYDSDGDDTMSVSQTRSLIAGPGYHVSARGFDSIVGIASAGGDDTANIYAADSDSQWHTTDDLLQWTGEDQAVRIARGFERANAFEDYEPIALQPLSMSSLITDEDERRERAIREADAARSVFESLGNESE